ncbi:hypothetical protein ABPG74_014986 [Tetrahymena malaccensis]
MQNSNDKLIQFEEKQKQITETINSTLNTIFKTNHKVKSLDELDIGSGLYTFGGTYSNTNYYYFTSGEFKNHIPIDIIQNSNQVYNWIKKNYNQKNNGGWWCIFHHSSTDFESREYYEDVETVNSYRENKYNIYKGDSLVNFGDLNEGTQSDENTLKSIQDLLQQIKQQSNKLRLEKQILQS